MRFALVVSCLLAAFAPLLPRETHAAQAAIEFPGWPASFEGEALEPLPLTERESGFLEAFPGRIARFRCGPRELVLRWVAQPTRRLHAASDCFRGAGYAIEPLPLLRDANGVPWSRFTATRQAERLTVSERIIDSAGASWTDPSAWFWAASTGATEGPWLAATVARRR